MVDGLGESMTLGCKSCHVIVAQGPSDTIEGLDMDLAGLDFIHPEDIEEAWREMKCTECHDPESGY